ncbi:MAG: LPS export ABC transporter periplasmic protein LptC [Steroidobacteraceae bacterium]
MYRIFVLLTVAAVLIGTLLLARQNRAPQAATVQRADTSDGYSARDAQLIETGANGLPLYTVDAASIRQLPREDRVQLSQVALTFQDPSGERWSATAEQGAIVHGTHEVQLSGHVHVNATLLGSQAPIQIQTDTLTFDSHSDRVSTPDPVTVRWAGQTLDATGLVVNLKAHRLHLESKVHAIVTLSH